MSIGWMIGAIVSAFGISIGCGLAWVLKHIQRGFAFIYALCMGMIIGLLFFEMIPESMELGGWITFVIGVGIGGLLFQYIHKLMGKITIITDNHQKDIFVRSGVLLTISIAIHNFPVGIALGSTVGTETENIMLTTLLLHNIPEGIIIFTPLLLAGFGIFSWLLFTTLVSIPIAAGSLLGQLFEIESSYLLAFILNIAISIIFMVAVKELSGEAVKHSSVISCLAIGGLGLGIIYLYLNLI
ncbi:MULTISPECIES: ZIP family metal transporter [Oceanobacillus]|uniref:ZIP family metal transporter n=1 Tax=Oceanobacillus TaxID=182709 RepID=UPI000596031B|nr:MULTISPECIES: ZIP family metal transporter [Oceanobacillus]